MAFDRIILGIDPGTSITGYGLIGCKGNQMELMNYGVIDLSRIKGDHALKLKRIFERVLGLIDEFKPDEVAIEAPFFGKNVQSMLKLGRAQGVAMAAALFREIPIREYAPKKIKMAITGNGNASKEMVNGMLEKLLHFKYDHKHLDASDGIAAAVCHYLQRTTTPGSGKKSYGSWGSFLKDNPDRMK